MDAFFIAAIIIIVLIAGGTFLTVCCCGDKCNSKNQSSPTEWNTYEENYYPSNNYNNGSEYVINSELREIEIPLDSDFTMTHTVHHSTDNHTGTGTGLAGDIGSGFADLFSSSGGHDSGGGGNDSGAGCDSGGGFDSGGGCDSGGGDVGSSSYD